MCLLVLDVLRTIMRCIKNFPDYMIRLEKNHSRMLNHPIDLFNFKLKKYDILLRKRHYVDTLMSNI